MKSNKLNLFGILVAFTIVLTASIQLQPSFAEEDEYLVYDDAVFRGLYFEYPNDWGIVDNADLPIIALFDLGDDAQLASVAVMHLQLEAETNSMGISDVFIDEIEKRNNESQIIQEGNRKVDDHNARETIISYMNNNEVLVKQHYVFVVADYNAYVFLLTASSDDYTKYQSSFNEFLNSLEITLETIPEFIGNKYDDSNIKAEFPKDWQTMKMIGYGEDRNNPINTVMSFPSEMMSSGGIDKVVGVAVVYMDLETTPSYLDALEESDCFLASNNVSIIEVNGMKALEFQMTCGVDGYEDKVNSLAYGITSEEKEFVLFYMAHEKQYDKNFSEFEKFADTVEIKDTINLSDYYESASAYGMTIKQDNLDITGNFDLPVVLYDNSIINDFMFDSKNGQISFQPVLNSEEYFQIDIEIDGLLNAPYFIDIKGEEADYFIISDATTDTTIISIFTESTTEFVTIQGTLHEDIRENDTDQVLIPAWIKSNAEFWAKDQIDDATFVSSIQFLIKNGILNVVPSSAATNTEITSNEIPAWIKSNAEFWSQGLISDNDFLGGIEYLVKHGIIKV